MKTVARSRHRISDGILVFIVVLFILLIISPLVMPFVRRDSGTFLYSGWRILNGEVPYRDIWDNKPPVIFYINAAGLAISGGSRWGVWGIEFISLLLAAFISFVLIKKIFGRLPALFSLCLWLLSFIGIISGGNYATEYTLPMQFACLWLAYESEKRGGYSWRGYLIGLLSGIAFFTKQNAAGIGLAIILFLLISKSKAGEWKKAVADLSLILLGGITTFVVIVSYLASKGAIQQFWEAAFIYNFIYSSSSLMGRVKSIITGMFYLSTLTLLAFIGWSASLVGLKFKKLALNKKIDPTIVPFLSIGLIDLPIELIMASISGYSYRHYFIALLPIYTVFAGFTFWMLLSQPSNSQIPKKIMRLLPVCIGIIFFILLLSASIASVYDINFTSHGIDYNEVTSYIRLNTTEDDFVLVWGYDPEINYSTQRRSPSRFVYQIPLYKAGYANQKIIEEFLEDIIQHEPRLIIDTKHPETPLYNFNFTSPGIEKALQFLRSSYKVKEELGPWTVYEYEGD